MKSLKIKTRIYVLSSISIILAFGLTACSSDSNKPAANPQNNQTTVQQNSSEKPNTYGNSSKETNNDKNTDKNTEKKENSNAPKLTKQQLAEGTKPKFSTPWITSTGGNNNACIEGTGEEASEEGVGKIFVKYKNGDIYSFEIADNKKVTPRYIQWADAENLMFIVGSAHGTVSKGGNLYLLNVSTGKVSTILETPDKKQQIVSAKKSENNINLKVNVYEDNEYNKSHMENWTIYSFSVNLNKKMEVKDSQGKLIYTINGDN